MSALHRLSKPLDYLRIQHPAKTKYDLVIPLACTVAGVCLFYFMPKTPAIFGQNGLISLINSLLQVLTGFFIASLAAVATFNKEGMDNTMPGDPPRLRVMERGRIKIIDLSRRRFLSLMFGYLSFISLFLYLGGGIANLFADSVKALVPQDWHGISRWGFLSLYIFLLANLLITTLLGLFYMSDRIHRHDPVLQSGTPPENAG